MIRLLAILSLVGALVLPAHAATYVPAASRSSAARPRSILGRQRELLRIRREIQARRSQLQAVRQRERRALDELETIDRARESAESRLASLEEELRRTRARTRATAGSLALVQVRLDRQRGRVTGRLRDIYKYGRRGYVDVLLDVADFSEFVARVHFLSTIMQADAQLLGDYQADVDRYRRLHAQLVAEQAEITGLIDQTDARRREIVERAQAKQQLLGRIQRERSLYEQVIADLERTDREIVLLIRRMQAGVPGPRGNPVLRYRQFIWPTRGTFTSGFGMRRHPIFGVRRLHSGVDIAAPRGAPVQAAWDGTVIYTGWFGGYGKIVVIDHGGGISTLYAHLSAILTRDGRRVRTGDVIGRVGSTGYSTGPHLHFEIRVNGTPVDPAAR